MLACADRQCAGFMHISVFVWAHAAMCSQRKEVGALLNLLYDSWLCRRLLQSENGMPFTREGGIHVTVAFLCVSLWASIFLFARTSLHEQKICCQLEAGQVLVIALVAPVVSLGGTFVPFGL